MCTSFWALQLRYRKLLSLQATVIRDCSRRSSVLWLMLLQHSCLVSSILFIWSRHLTVCLQALSSPLSSTAVYGPAQPTSPGSTPIPTNFPANPYLYALPSFGISTDSVGLQYPPPGAGVPPSVGVFPSPPNELTSPGMFPFRYSANIMNTSATGIIDSGFPTVGGHGEVGMSAVRLPYEMIGPVTQTDGSLLHSFCGSLVQQQHKQQQQKEHQKQQRFVNSSQPPSGLLLVGTLEQVQQALSLIRTRANTPHVPFTDCLNSTPSPPVPASTPTLTTSFVTDGPLRVDRIQPLSLPTDWVKPWWTSQRCASGINNNSICVI